MAEERSLTVRFEGEGVTVSANNDAAQELLNFLLKDLPQSGEPPSSVRYDLVAAGPRPIYSLWQGDKRLYFGPSRYKTAYMLMNEIIYHCILQNEQRFAIHAGAVHNGRNCILLPGKSGSGKSSITAWLLTRRFKYLTDELVFLSEDGTIQPFCRPISTKGKPVDSLYSFIDGNEGKLIQDNNGAMLPHRLLNPDFTESAPQLTYIIFPVYSKSEQTQMVPLSAARSCMMLLESHVNARSFPGLGVSSISRIVKRCTSFKMIYNNFNDLESTLLPMLSMKSLG